MSSLVIKAEGYSRKSPEDIRRMILENDIKVVDLRFNDLPGLWQHFSLPAEEVLADIEEGNGILKDGIGFDGSSIRGFQKIQESDMILRMDLDTAFVDPVAKTPTLVVICDIYDPITKQPYTRDPRYIAKKAERFLKESGIADLSYWGPEAEFFVFDDVRFDQGENFGFYFVDSIEGDWNTGREENPNLGYKPRYKEGYFPVPPHDTLQEFRNEIMLTLRSLGVPIEVHHHEVSSGGQCEIDIRYGTLTRTADNLLIYKYVIKNLARRYNKTVTFMPKPIFGDNGSGMHTHQSLWKGDQNIFYDKDGYASLSQIALWYIGGLLKHAPAVLAFAAPTTNSYKRLIPGFEAPVNLVYSARNRSAAIRIPMYSDNPKAKRIEFRPPDPSCNPYLAFAAMLMAGIDGVINKIDPGNAFDKNVYELSTRERNKIKSVPRSLEEALNALEKDCEFLLRGDVFTKDVIETWIEYKRNVEIEGVNLRPHPHEFYLYFDI